MKNQEARGWFGCCLSYAVILNEVKDPCIDEVKDPCVNEVKEHGISSMTRKALSGS